MTLTADDVKSIEPVTHVQERPAAGGTRIAHVPEGENSPVDVLAAKRWTLLDYVLDAPKLLDDHGLHYTKI